ncbi:MAG: anaerobic ribonucleoside-triphosphate reductase activating protein [Gammaproteobacteria bacterium]|jgi:pyruvate formate lyase activating enzyme|nr:anaerobic ribonucleoside-triphosphate reductase activating protein [Gammaproteobacteria bacterium]
MSNTLRIGGLTALTSVDYPGELAAVVYCQGCPWRCPYCHNGHLLEEAGHDADLLDWSEVIGRLESRRGLLDAVVFSGGEPTVQAALADAMAEVRALGFKVGLHTGGPYPERLQRLLPHLDWVGLDIKALPEDYPQVTTVPGSGERAWQSLRLLLDAGVDLEVRTTPMPGLDDDAYLQRLMQQLADAGVRNYVLQQCQPAHLRDGSLRDRLRGLPEQWPSVPFEQFALRAA